jgi:hypothetical protein
MITSFLLAKLVPMLVGSPGCGKSQIVHQIAANFGLKVIDLRLSQCDPTDLMGFPHIEGNKAGYKPMETFPIEGDPLPHGYNGWLLFLDEMNAASTAVQAAAYKLVLDRMVGIFHLHKNVAVVCAGNLETDNAIVQPMSTALQSRLVHLELVADPKEWIDWATSNDIDFRITSYINFKPGSLYSFMPDHPDNTYACPRTWEFANRVLKQVEVDSKDALPMLAGTVSEGIAREFISFCRIYQDLPTPIQITQNPETLKVPDSPSILFALTGSIANNANDDNIGQLMKYVKRLPIEFQVVCLRETVRRTPELNKHKAVREWISTTAHDLF